MSALTSGPSAPLGSSGGGSYAGRMRVPSQEETPAVALGWSSFSGKGRTHGEGGRWWLILAIALDSPVQGKERLLFRCLYLARMMLAELHRALMEAVMSDSEVSASYRLEQPSATNHCWCNCSILWFLCPHLTTQNCKDKCNRHFSGLLLSFACHLQ